MWNFCDGFPKISKLPQSQSTMSAEMPFTLFPKTKRSKNKNHDKVCMSSYFNLYPNPVKYVSDALEITKIISKHLLYSYDSPFTRIFKFNENSKMGQQRIVIVQ